MASDVRIKKQPRKHSSSKQSQHDSDTSSQYSLPPKSNRKTLDPLPKPPSAANLEKNLMQSEWQRQQSKVYEKLIGQTNLK